MRYNLSYCSTQALLKELYSRGFSFRDVEYEKSFDEFSNFRQACINLGTCFCESIEDRVSHLLAVYVFALGVFAGTLI